MLVCSVMFSCGRLCLAMLGYVLVRSSYVWLCLAVFGAVCLCLVRLATCGYTWLCLVVCG